MWLNDWWVYIVGWAVHHWLLQVSCWHDFMPFSMFLVLCAVSVRLLIWYTDIWRVNVLCVKTGSTTVFKFCKKKKILFQSSTTNYFPQCPAHRSRQPDLIYEQLLGTWWCCTVTWKVLLFLSFFFSQTLCVLVKYFEINRISWEGIF